MNDHYSPERRTALVLAGTGADGAYHAGVLRAVQETGVKIDLVCGRGMGAVSAVFTAIDGSARLWDPGGLWRRPGVGKLYGWRTSMRLLLGVAAFILLVLASPIVFLAIGLIAYVAALLLGMAGLELGAQLLTHYGDMLTAAFSPRVLPTWLPRVITLAVLVALVLLLAAGWSRLGWARGRRGHQRWWASLLTPIDRDQAARYFTAGLWELLKGGANLRVPERSDLSRRFTEMLNDNLGQPGFCELLLTVHDLDARRDLVFGLIREPFRRALFPMTAPGPGMLSGTVRRAEAFDLAGAVGGELVNVLNAALSVPLVTEPALVQFGADSYWRGESHRLADRPAALGRLLEEASAAGAEQVILVSGAAELPGPHELRRPRLDLRGRLSDLTESAEAIALRDALHQVQHRFKAVYVIRPRHNPVGAFDLGGAFDDQSDREQSLAECIERAYEDAYRQFIEPIVGHSGEQLRG